MKQLKLTPQVRWVGVPFAERHQSVDTSAPIETVYFTLCFNMPTRAERAELLLSAHSRYKLYVNGKLITYGPCKSDEWHRYAERVELSGYLMQGANRITVLVVSYPPRECESGGHAGPQWSYNKACGCCFLADGVIEGDGGLQIPLSTGHACWRYYVSDEMMPVADTVAPWLGYKEDVSGEKKPIFHMLADTWPPAVSLFDANTDQYGILPIFPLYERTIPLLYLEPKDFAVGLNGQKHIGSGEKAVFLLDAGELTTGFPRFPMSGGAGATVRVTYAEAFFFEDEKRPVKLRRDDKNGYIYGHADIFRPSGKDDVYEPFHFRTFRYIELTVETAEAPLVIYEPSYQETGYPLMTITEPVGENTDWVRQLWDMSLRTLRRCLHETYEDCPYYEQLQYTMDTRLQILFTYALGGDTRLARKSILEYHASQLPDGMLQSRYPSSVPQVIPVFSLHWIFMLRDYYEETGDSEFLRGYLGTVDRILHYFRRHKQDGLVAFLGYWETVDWTAAWADNVGVPHACKYGASTIQNFQYAYALQIAAELYEIFGFGDVAASYRAEAEEIKTALTKLCRNGTLYREGPQIEEYSCHAQLWAVLAGVGDNRFRKALMQNVLRNDTLIPCSFPTMFYLMRALEQAGLYEQTEHLWQYWKDLFPLGLTTIPETSFGHARSDCHAWGSLMLYEFPRSFLGVRPGSPGWKTVLVEPKGFFVPKVSGKVFVPGGTVTVKRTISGSMVHIEITPDCPQPVMLRLPDNSEHRLKNRVTAQFTADCAASQMR